MHNLMSYAANSSSKPKHSLELSFKIAKYRGERLDHHRKALKLKGYTDDVFCLAEKDVNFKFNL